MSPTRAWSALKGASDMARVSLAIDCPTRSAPEFAVFIAEMLTHTSDGEVGCEKYSLQVQPGSVVLSVEDALVVMLRPIVRQAYQLQSYFENPNLLGV